jgi:hypothetical protein
MLGDIFHDSDLILDLFTASDDPAKDSKANQDT